MGRRRPKGIRSAEGPPRGPAEPEPRAQPTRLNARHRATLVRVFERPARPDIPWRSIEALFIALGGEVTPGRGSRRRVALHGVRAIFHEPHPERVADKGAVEDVREFLERAGVTP